MAAPGAGASPGAEPPCAGLLRADAKPQLRVRRPLTPLTYRHAKPEGDSPKNVVKKPTLSRDRDRARHAVGGVASEPSSATASNVMVPRIVAPYGGGQEGADTSSPVLTARSMLSRGLDRKRHGGDVVDVERPLSPAAPPHAVAGGGCVGTPPPPRPGGVGSPARSGGMGGVSSGSQARLWYAPAAWGGTPQYGGAPGAEAAEARPAPWSPAPSPGAAAAGGVGTPPRPGGACGQQSGALWAAVAGSPQQAVAGTPPRHGAAIGQQHGVFRMHTPGTPPHPGPPAAGSPQPPGARSSSNPPLGPVAYAQVKEAISPAQVRVIGPTGVATPRVPLAAGSSPLQPTSLASQQGVAASASDAGRRVATSITYVMPQLGEQPVDRYVVAQSGDRLSPRGSSAQARGRSPIILEPVAISPGHASAKARSSSDRSVSASAASASGEHPSYSGSQPLLASPIRWTTSQSSPRLHSEQQSYRGLSPAGHAAKPMAFSPYCYTIRRTLP